MNRYTIEKRDREVVEKFRGIVESKEQRRKKGRLRLGGLLLIIVCAGLFIFHKDDAPPPLTKTVMHKSNTIALQRVTEETLNLQTEKDLPEQSTGEYQPTTMASAIPDLHPKEPDLKAGVPTDPQPENPVLAVKQTLPESAQQYLSAFRKIEILNDTGGDEL